MNHNMDWFNRVYETLQEEDTYELEGPELFEALQFNLEFRANKGERHPTIELYDYEDGMRIGHICYDPANVQFYLPVYDDNIDKKMHLLLESFDEILTFFLGAWVNHSNEHDTKESDEDFFSKHIMSDEGKKIITQQLSDFLIDKEHEERHQEKLKNIKWLDEEELIESVKIKSPVPSERQIILKLGVIEGTNERVLGKESRVLHDGEVSHGSGQVFLINQDELSTLTNMIKKHFL